MLLQSMSKPDIWLRSTPMDVPNAAPSIVQPMASARANPPVSVPTAASSIVQPTTSLSDIALTRKAPGNQPDAFIKKDDKKAEVNEICLFHIWQFCKLVNKCTQMHYHLPYRWQYLASTEWTDLPNMEEIEKAFCDPKINRTSVVDFQTMKRNLTIPVRRASTVSSVTRSSEFVLTTEWVWHWQDEHGTWIEYGKSSTTQQSASILSADLENIYLADQKATVPFQAGKQIYEINFQEMVQRNVTYKTQKEVRRRPRFLSFDDVRKLRGSTKSVQAISPLKTGAYPPNWDSKALPDLGYQVLFEGWGV
ncbi:hypothetical protein FKM82_011681 [Ascaphus truei]